MLVSEVLQFTLKQLIDSALLTMKQSHWSRATEYGLGSNASACSVCRLCLLHGVIRTGEGSHAHTVISLDDNCVDHQENCPNITRSLFRGAIAVRMK